MVVSGPPLIRGSGIWLNVSAVVNDHVLLNKSVALGDFVARKRRVIPFLVYGTGCGDLAISVSISDDELEGEGVKETIHFPCGE